MPLNPESQTYASKIEQINKILIELASGNFETEIIPSDDRDELDAIVAGINMLREELVHSTVSTEFLEGVYNGIVDILIVTTPDFRIKNINATTSTLLEYNEEELLEEHLLRLVSDNFQDDFIGSIEELKKSGSLRNIESEFVTKSKKNIPISYSVSHLRNKFDVKIGYLYIAKDMSKIKETEQQLLNKNKELDTFVYKSSHDLKGPLASIIGLTNIANMEVKDEVSLNYFNLIRTSAIRLDNILVNLSELARLRNSATKIGEVNLKQTVDEIFEQYQVDGNLKKIISFVNEVEEIEEFYSNDKIVLSVLQNLIDNAIKYRKISVGANPYVHVSGKPHSNGYLITVKDNGLGIRKDKIEKVFDMFERANEKSQGTGLGLYIVKTSVEKLGGWITMQSEERQGSTFTLFLPCLEKDQLIN